VFLAKYNYGDLVKEDKIVRACDTDGREEECLLDFDVKT
jgi:hypothetical protein